jgi:hypothetical protein
MDGLEDCTDHAIVDGWASVADGKWTLALGLTFIPSVITYKAPHMSTAVQLSIVIMSNYTMIRGRNRSVHCSSNNNELFMRTTWLIVCSWWGRSISRTNIIIKDKSLYLMMRHLHWARNTKRNNISIRAPNLSVIFISDCEWSDRRLQTQSCHELLNGVSIYNIQIKTKYDMEGHHICLVVYISISILQLDLSLFFCICLCLYYSSIFLFHYHYIYLYHYIFIYLYLFSLSMSISIFILKWG